MKRNPFIVSLFFISVHNFGQNLRVIYTSKLEKEFIPAILSLFIIGLGQIYNKEIKKGISIFLIVLIIYGLFVPADNIFFLPIIIIWIYSIYDAYNTAKGIKIIILDELSKLRIYGFRSKKRWKILIAIPAYLVLFLLFLAFLSVILFPDSIKEKSKGPIGEITEKINDTLHNNTGAKLIEYNNSEAPVLLYGEKTDVVLGEDILLRLSAANLINKPLMNVQVLLYAPSGMSITSTEFVKSGSGIYTTTYKLEPGDSRDIGVIIKTNQAGSFNIKGRIVYYFDDKNNTVDQVLLLPVRVRSIEK